VAFTMRDYYRNLKAGACPMCGGERDAEGFYCRRCLAMSRLRQSRIPRRWKTGYQARYRVRNRKAHLCPEDGRVPAPGRLYCQRCIDKRKAHRNVTP